MERHWVIELQEDIAIGNKYSWSFFCSFVYVVERSDSGVELRTLDYKNPGSNPVLWC